MGTENVQVGEMSGGICPSGNVEGDVPHSRNIVATCVISVRSQVRAKI